MDVNYIIYALGMKGEVIDKVFAPYREADGTFPIFSEELQEKNESDKLQKAENEIPRITTVAEAVSYIRKPGFRWRLKEHAAGQANIFKSYHIKIHEL